MIFTKKLTEDQVKFKKLNQKILNQVMLLWLH